jgi:hypothetical protein
MRTTTITSTTIATTNEAANDYVFCVGVKHGLVL